jgi:pilus assembly protein CpaE
MQMRDLLSGSGTNGELGRAVSSVHHGSAPGAEVRRQSSSRRKSRVLVAVRDMGLQQEMLDHLERDARLEITAALDDLGASARVRAMSDLDAIAACPEFAQRLGHPAARTDGPSLVMVAQEMTVPILREAIDAGAREVFAWPEERQQLADALALLRSEDMPERTRGRVVAVLGARGGAGTTFVASHIAASLADLGARAAIVDLDCAFGGLTVALGIGAEQGMRTISDLVPVADEVAPEHVEDALYAHPRGFAALLAPSAADHFADVTPALVRAAVSLLAASHEGVVLHLPRGADDVATTGLAVADAIILVTTQDLFSLYGAKRAMWQLRLDDPGGRCRVVVNRFGRGQLVTTDIARVLGVRPWATVRFDAAVRRAQDLGQLLPPKSRRAARDVRALARNLVAPDAGHRQQDGTNTPSRRRRRERRG